MNSVADKQGCKRLSESRNVAVVQDRVDSRHLFVDTRETTISHGADVYRLRLTSQNKLILTK